MIRPFLIKAVTTSRSSLRVSHFTLQRMIHSRNKLAREHIIRARAYIKEVDRVKDHAAINDSRLLPDLRKAKAQLETALEVDPLNTDARYYLSKLHFDYHTPGACKIVGAALLVEAAKMGNAEAQYDMGRRLRMDGNGPINADHLAFHYIEKAVDQLHPGALFLLGIVYVTGDCVKQDVFTALWCFHRASQKGHPGAAIAYGSLLLKGHQLPESLKKFKKRPSLAKSSRHVDYNDLNPLEMAKEQFEIAAKAGSDLGFLWLKRVEEEEKRVLALESLAAEGSKDSEVTPRQ